MQCIRPRPNPTAPATVPQQRITQFYLFELFLGAQLARVSAFLLSAVGGTGWETRIAFSADGLVAVESLGEEGQRRVVDTTTEAEHQVQSRLLLDVVIAQRAAVFELFSSENQALLIRRDALLVLDLGFDIVDRVAGLHVERDGLARQALDENLHDGRTQANEQSTKSNRRFVRCLLLLLAACLPAERRRSFLVRRANARAFHAHKLKAQENAPAKIVSGKRFGTQVSN